MAPLEHVNLTDNKLIAIKKIVADDLQIQLQNDVFSIQQKENTSRSLIEVEFELNQAQALNHVSLPIEGLKNSGGIWVNIFFSENGEFWKKAPLKDNQISEHNTELEIPLIEARFLQLVFYGKTLEKIQNFKIKNGQISKNLAIKTKASSHLDRLWVAENLIDHRDDYGWASEKRGKNKEDIIQFDLGSEFYLSAIQLKSVNESPNCFPVGFSLALSMDSSNWESVANEHDFIVRKFSWYNWSFSPKRARYIQIQISNHFKLNQNEYLSKILELEARAICENKLHVISNQDGLQIDYASELVPGLVVLAENNMAAPNKAVQSNDARLRKATVEYPGIVQLAKDNEVNDYVAVQGSDSRLKNASEQHPGIVQLAKNGEDKVAVVVQGNDIRLKLASDEAAGIVKLAKNGDDRAQVVVQGNDHRLKNASESHPGIVRLAKDGEVKNEAVVQGSDSRLRQGSISWPGIVQFAAANEEIELKALQANDPRLKKASESEFGRVVLAKNNEEAALKVVQSNDDRLKEATTDRSGLVRLAIHGKNTQKSVVQADDPRLNDKREPLEHQHDYADKNHDLNSHSGYLNIQADINSVDNNSGLLPLKQYPLSVENKQGRAAAFQGGISVASQKEDALLILADKNGMMATAKKGHAGVFLSENDFALSLPLQLGNIKGSQKSIKAEGSVELGENLKLTAAGAVTIRAVNFSDEAFAEGDILTIQSGKFMKLKNSSQSVAGIYTQKNSLQLEASGGSKNDRAIFIAVAGLIQVKIKGPVKSGQIIGSGGENAGVGRALSDSQNSRGRAILSIEEKDDQGEKLVWCLI